MKNGHAWMPRLITGLGSLVLMLGILTAFQYGKPQVPGAPRAAAPPTMRTVAFRASGAAASRVVTTSPAVTIRDEYCHYNSGTACLNAWGGGPWVDVYTGGPETRDNNAYFNIIYDHTTGYSQIEFTGGGSWNGDCIGDAYNKSGYADTSLDSCGSTKGAAGWGTDFVVGNSGCSTGQEWFYNVRWKGYLGPPNGWTNGSHFYLNNKDYACFDYYLYMS